MKALANWARARGGVAVADADIEETLTRQACAQGVTSRRAPITVRN